MRTLKAPWGKMLWVASAAATLILAGVAAIPVPGVWWTRLIPLAILMGTAPFVVCSYTIQDNELRVRRLWWSTRIDLRGLRSVVADTGAMRCSLRTCGNGGLFSFTGWYWNRRLGSYRAYVTDPSRAVVLAFDKRRIVVSPDDPAAFVRLLAARLPR